MTLALASITSLAIGIAIGFAAARVQISQRKPAADPFASPGMPYAGIIDADFETIVRRSEGT